MENCYLKLFHVLFTTKPADSAGLIEGYKSVFPDESALIDALVKEVLFAEPLQAVPAIWLANRNFQVGTSLFDQFRSLPRLNTFDLNAATSIDLLSVPGMTRSWATLILKNTPYSSLQDLRRVPGLPQGMLGQFLEMSRAMDQFKTESAENDTVFSIRVILKSYAWRALGILGLASAAGMLLYRRLRSVRWMRAAANGFAASFLVLTLAC